MRWIRKMLGLQHRPPATSRPEPDPTKKELEQKVRTDWDRVTDVAITNARLYSENGFVEAITRSVLGGHRE